MPYYTKEQIQQARQVDLLTYLQCHDPGELVHVSGGTYCTKSHDSLKISNGKWCWWSHNIGGST
ncbi:MAG: topoisomerase, partial [Flavonifractor plautii]